jgi:hypothetical protein
VCLQYWIAIYANKPYYNLYPYIKLASNIFPHLPEYFMYSHFLFPSLHWNASLKMKRRWITLMRSSYRGEWLPWSIACGVRAFHYCVFWESLLSVVKTIIMQENLYIWDIGYYGFTFLVDMCKNLFLGTHIMSIQFCPQNWVWQYLW